MNSISIHNIKEIKISEVKDLEGVFSQTITIYQNSEYVNAENDIYFEITMFSKNPNNLKINKR